MLPVRPRGVAAAPEHQLARPAAAADAAELVLVVRAEEGEGGGFGGEQRRQRVGRESKPAEAAQPKLVDEAAARARARARAAGVGAAEKLGERDGRRQLGRGGGGRGGGGGWICFTPSFLTSSMEEIPPDIMKGIFTLLDNSIVSFIFGPFFVPSLLISV